MLEARTALVTGAGKGIGRAVAAALVREGARVGLVARTRADLDRVAEELAGFSGDDASRIAVAAADVGQRDQVERAVAELRKRLGPIDVLVNNAGIAKFGAILDMPPEDWEAMQRVNVLGTYYVTRAVLPDMIAARRGDVINVASTAGEKGVANTSSYAASKAAVLRFTESLAAEVRRHDVRVTALLPSTVNTELASAVGLTIGPEERMMQTDDVAQLVVAMLRLPPRVFVRDVSLLTTNPV
ncbi:3-ketoacyl-ACP reductase [Roseisolibacter sp. H3M3-2]|uniref:3-ketoacyl-ACP reductase n=1 Tax=Roseisolibacter sp. H3M3-2 TaxID=3031323 RepID=UPI0023DBFFB0|nr:3-ketoacyl-ACP reductase [Roseisolibacter sp. H3M3-2]MDF1501708.1 3-ketoacyl-ACP reductase [Roseisolibacter sp. H3M3-2]